MELNSKHFPSSFGQMSYKYDGKGKKSNRCRHINNYPKNLHFVPFILENVAKET